MVFSSILFIFYFLTSLLVIYFITPNRYKNLVLLVFSLLFYFLGEPKNIIFLIISCLINYYSSIFIYKKKNKKIFVFALLYNVIQLFYFKYTDFFINNINNLFHINISLLRIALPIGISFYTFQAISYITDVYLGRHKPAKSLIEFSTYLCLFPQLVAGPIVRFNDIKKDIVCPKINIKDFSNGVKRFIIGLSKKVLLANVLGELILKFTTKTIVNSWLKPICYTLQIYFDFSGYSDMAIGLGLMLGFHFLENFNYPLIAKNITDFWHRWHISLSSWFKDYIYIPLGGNRTSKIKWIRNIFIVWFLTGLWHGANWNFIIWGLYFGIILIIEKLFLKKYLDKSKFFSHLYTIIIIIISFLIFSNENINIIFNELKNMFFINKISFIDKETIFYLRDYLVILIISIVSATPILKLLLLKIKNTKLKQILNICEVFAMISLFILSISFIIDQSFNPFLYFRF